MKITKQRAKELMDTIELVLGPDKRTAKLTITDFAKITGKHRMTIWKACARGDLPATQERKNCKYNIDYSELDRYLTPEASA